MRRNYADNKSRKLFFAFLNFLMAADKDRLKVRQNLCASFFWNILWYRMNNLLLQFMKSHLHVLTWVSSQSLNKTYIFMC